MATGPKKGGTVSAARRLPQRTLDRIVVSSNGSAPARVGLTVSGAVRLPPATLDRLDQRRKASVWLVVKLRYPAGVSAEVVAEHAHRIVEAMKALDPDLGLVYDPERSTEDAERRIVSVALTPCEMPGDVEERLNKLLAKGRKVEPNAPVVSVAMEWDHPVAV